MTKQVQSFVFSGLLAKHAVRDMQAAGLLRDRAVSGEERQDQDLLASVQENIRSGALAMQRTFRILFVLENVVRSLIDGRLTDKYGSNWFDKKATTPMKKKLKDRKEKEDKNQWHAGRNKEPLYYMDFGDLARLIVNNWTEFDDFLPSQSWVQSRLDEAERSRNVIAHTNILSSEEASRLEMYLRDWIKQIG
ncbi:MAG: Swt1 family HEPN domain-containing protein [Gammaproteobacteria bacterium]|nr:Swt1 family HEPN domain-containing protein [Gammaproteobacteria bacterium]